MQTFDSRSGDFFFLKDSQVRNCIQIEANEWHVLQGLQEIAEEKATK